MLLSAFSARQATCLTALPDDMAAAPICGALAPRRAVEKESQQLTIADDSILTRCDIYRHAAAPPQPSMRAQTEKTAF